MSNPLKRVAIVGPNARKPIAGGAGSAAVNPFYITTPEVVQPREQYGGNQDRPERLPMYYCQYRWGR
jgi:hypothetical protein